MLETGPTEPKETPPPQPEPPADERTDEAPNAPEATADPPAVDEALETLREAHKTGHPVRGLITGLQAGGLEVEIAGKQAFCPVSQIDLAQVPDPTVFVSQTHDFRVLELGEGGQRIVISRRALLKQQEEERAAHLRESLHVGEVREGKVARIESFGAFVDLGGLDGLVHISEISHDRIAHPSSALKVGQTVRVQILEIGKDARGRNRISLSIKAAQQDPWVEVNQLLEEGQTVTGRIMRLTEFGAFVRLLPGIEGLVHVSEIRDERVEDPRMILKEGDDAKVRILNIDPRRKRISLTMRLEASKGGKARVGQTLEGVIRAHKPYGIFIDLPSCGSRVSGLLPLEETGVSRKGDLTKKFPAGQKLDVMVQQIDEKGRIRLGLPSTGSAQAVANLGARGVSRAMADALRRALGENPES